MLAQTSTRLRPSIFHLYAARSRSSGRAGACNDNTEEHMEGEPDPELRFIEAVFKRIQSRHRNDVVQWENSLIVLERLI